jgi:hypothetical protein
MFVLLSYYRFQKPQEENEVQEQTKIMEIEQLLMLLQRYLKLLVKQL